MDIKTEEKIKELFKEDEFVEKYEKVKSIDDLTTLLSNYGISISEEDAQKIEEEAQKGIEIDEEFLENVSGGGSCCRPNYFRMILRHGIFYSLGYRLTHGC